MKSTENVKNKGTRRIIRKRKNLFQDFEKVVDIKDIKDIKKNDNGEGELNLTEQNIADLFARGTRQHEICRKTNYSPGRVSQILQKPEVKKEIRTIQDNFFSQIDTTIQEAYATGWAQWQEKALAGDLTPEQLLEGLNHIETLRGLRTVQIDGVVAPLTLTETTQKRISLAENLNKLPDKDRLTTLKAIGNLIGAKPEEEGFKEEAIDIEKG